jgi:hypothetical protein
LVLLGRTVWHSERLIILLKSKILLKLKAVQNARAPFSINACLLVAGQLLSAKHWFLFKIEWNFWSFKMICICETCLKCNNP